MPATVELLATRVAVRPGGTASATIRVTNTGRIVDEITLEPLGEVVPWMTVAPTSLALFPGAMGQATVTFGPPRGAQPAAGTYPFAVRVRSREDRAFSFVAEGRVEVGVLMDVVARMSPRTSTASRLGQGATHRLEVENNGNTTAGVRISAADADERLRFTVVPEVLSIPPGARSVAALKVRAKRRQWSGQPTGLPFQVGVAPDGATPIPLDGTLSQRATLVFGLTQVAAAVISVGVVAAIALGAGQTLLKSPEPLASASAGPTATLAALATPLPTPATTPAPTATLSLVTASPTIPPSSTPPPSSAAPVTPAPTSPPPVTSAPTAGPSPSPSPLTVRILNLGLTDPNAPPVIETPGPTEPPEPTPAPTAGPSGTFEPPIRVLPSWPVVVFATQGTQSGGTATATESDGGGAAVTGSSAGLVLALAAKGGHVFTLTGPIVTQDEPQRPAQQFALQVDGPVTARIRSVHDATHPRLCLAAEGGSENCNQDQGAVVDSPRGTRSPLRFLSVVAEQGGTTVDIEIEYPPQPATLFFRNVHLAGGMAPSGMEVVVQPSRDADLIVVVVNEQSVAGAITASITDLSAAPQAPVTNLMILGKSFYIAGLQGHLYKIEIKGDAAGELFISGSLSWP